MGWLKGNEIRWAEQRICERDLIERERNLGLQEHQRHHPEWNKSGEWEKEDYQAWLLHVRDELSFQSIGDLLFDKDQTPDGRKMKARRAWARVEWEFGRGPLKRKPRPLGFAILGGQIVLKSSVRRAQRSHMKRTVFATILAALTLASCGGGTSSTSSSPPVHAAGPPALSGTYAFSLTSPNGNNPIPMTGVFTATPPTTTGGQGNISGELFAAQGTNFCSNTFIGTFQVNSNNGLVTGTLTFSMPIGFAACYINGNASFTASPGASSSPGGSGSRVFLSVGSLNIPAASGEAVLQ